MPKLFMIGESKTRFGCFYVQNRVLCVVFGIFQLGFAAASLSQHIFSLWFHHNIFLCVSNQSIADSLNISRFLGYDLIIFDFGLFNHLLGMSECVANYLDGGYLRCLWCLSHTGSALLLLLILTSEDRKFLFLPRIICYCPTILQQNMYSLGLIVLNLATLPKLMVAIFAKRQPRILGLILVFLVGEALTCFSTLVLWHYYWYIEEVHLKEEKEEKERMEAENNSPEPEDALMGEPREDSDEF